MRSVDAALDRGDLDAAATPPTGARRSTRSRSGRSSRRALVAERRGDETAALAAYRGRGRAPAARTRRPGTSSGLFEFDLGDRCAAYGHLNEAYTLDPPDAVGPGRTARRRPARWVNAGNCCR